jgi:hypothetical protein
MAAVTIVVPRMLAVLAKDERRIDVEAGSVRGALEALFDRHPELRVHVFAEGGELREHVRCFHNNDPVLAPDDWERAAATGDTVTILQAVSGG